MGDEWIAMTVSRQRNETCPPIFAFRWFHQVRSYGPRNLAINIWFGHKLKFNSTDCEHSPYKDQQFAPLSEFKVSENLGASLS